MVSAGRSDKTRAQDVPLSWSRLDFEQRLGFSGARYTRVNNVLAFLIACLLSLAFYGCVFLVRETSFGAMFLERGPTQYFTVLLAAWSLAILSIKTQKIRLQRRALTFEVVPRSHSFVLSSATVGQVMDTIYSTVDDPRHFVLFNRIAVALANLRNLGRVSDLDDILRSQGEQDESSMETSFSLVQGFVWAIPVLGFIGTVLGLSESIAAFSGVLGAAEEVSEISSALRGVTAGLATAFETTLAALVAALVIQLFLTMLKKGEEEFLDDCSEYCLREVVGRLRILPFESEVD